MWAMMATCFIIWDTATIPLEMFPVDRVFGQARNFTSAFAVSDARFMSGIKVRVLRIHVTSSVVCPTSSVLGS